MTTETQEALSAEELDRLELMFADCRESQKIAPISGDMVFRLIVAARSRALPEAATGGGLREALEPFARCLVDVGESEADDDTFDNRMSHNYAPRITAGDIRRAHAALAATGEKAETQAIQAAALKLAEVSGAPRYKGYVDGTGETAVLTLRAEEDVRAVLAAYRAALAPPAPEVSA